MTGFANLVANLNLNIQNFSNGLQNASRQARRFSDNLRGQINNGIVDPVKKSKVEFKDVARIVQGIIISKVFYSGLNAIRQATNAVWEFSQELEYAKIAYSNLFGDTALAEEFINVLKDFAALSPFSFTESEAAAKRLLAYGIQYKNVMYVMQGIMSAASMQGDPSKIESISRALGQIYTKGRLMGDEMKQLTEAGIPAWEILEEKLGLTKDQIGNIADAGIPASKAINALVDGMNERFGNVVTASSRTIKGIISNIKDNATMLMSGLMEPLVVKAKSALNALGELLFKLREIYELKGAGGVFEELIPPELQAMVRQFLATLQNLHQAMVNLFMAVAGFLKPVLVSLIQVFNVFGPVLATVINALAAVLSMITSNATLMRILTVVLTACATAWVLFKIKALAALVVAKVANAISKSLLFLKTVMDFIVVHPLWALLIGVTSLLVGLAVGFDKIGNAINNMFSKLNKAAGYDPDKLLLPSQKERANDLDKFNEKLDTTTDTMDDLADSTGKATKAAKNLLSFDEVFKLNEPDETGTNTKDEDFSFDPSDLELDGDAFIPEVPDFTGFVNNWLSELISKFKERIAGAGLGAIIGAALGGILGGPLGAKIGAIAGAIAGWFWTDLAEALKLTEYGKIAIPITTGLGAVIGGIVGGPLGMAVGAAIGLLAGWMIDALALGVETGDWSRIAMPIGGSIGAVIGGIIGGPAGILIGAGIGTLVGWIINAVIDAFSGGDWQLVAPPIGAGLGAVIGGIAGGPVGALIGAGLGTLVGWAVTKLAELFGDYSWDEIANAFKEWGKDIGKAFLDGLFGEGGLFGWSTELFRIAGEFFKDAKEAFNNHDFGELGKNVVLGILHGLAGAVTFIFEPISRLFQAIVNAICAVFGIHSPAESMKPLGKNILLGLLQGIVDAVTVIPSYIAQVGMEVISTVSGWFTNIGSTVVGILGKMTTAAIDFVDNTATKISGWATSAGSAIATWATDAATNIVTFTSNAISKVGSFATSTGNKITNWASTAGHNIASFANKADNKINNFATAAGNKLKTWATNAGSTITTWATTAGSTITSWYSSAKSKFESFLGISFSGWASNTLSTITSWASNVWDTIDSYLSKAIGKIKEFFSTDKTGVSLTSIKTTTTTNTTRDKYNGNDFVATFNDKYFKTGHAVGGVFNREHYAKFAEDNKAEAIIPLENSSAMQPFVDAVSNGLTASLAPILTTVTSNQNNNMQPLYVGTLVADERGLKELERKMKVIRMQEDRRG